MTGRRAIVGGVVLAVATVAATNPYVWPVLGGFRLWAFACRLDRVIRRLREDGAGTELDPVA